MRKLIIILSVFQCLLLKGQDLDYAKEVVKTLAAPEFYGRGYVEKGDLIAASYISDQFEKIGLKSFEKNYFQKFNTSVNTFPGTMNLQIGSNKLIPGVDFLVEPYSPGISGTFKSVFVPINDLLTRSAQDIVSQSNGKFLVIESFSRTDYTTEQLSYIDSFLTTLRSLPANTIAGVLLLTNEKLTWSASTIALNIPVFKIKSRSFVPAQNEVKVDVENVFIRNYSSQNVIGHVEGLNQDSLIVFIAHYDHLGMMGESTVFPGANDNASGIAMLLNLARHYSNKQPRFTTVFIALGGEEIGLVGSRHFVENPLFQLNKIKFLINFDISGTGRDGIQVVNGSVHKDQFESLRRINEEQDLLFQVKVRGAACNSDHCMFDLAQVPTFFIYTLGGIQAYHDVYDKYETLPLTAFENYFKLIIEFVSVL